MCTIGVGFDNRTLTNVYVCTASGFCKLISIEINAESIVIARFDNEQDRSPTAEAMYIEELREFREYMAAHTDVAELKALNLLGVQFALCEASKWFFYLRCETGPIYKPSSRDFSLTLQEVAESDAHRLRAIWQYWEEAVEEPCEIIDELHPDHRIVLE